MFSSHKYLQEIIRPCGSDSNFGTHIPEEAVDISDEYLGKSKLLSGTFSTSLKL
jgi:hypothetical protein